MKKSFLLLSIVGCFFVMNAHAARLGEVVGVSGGGYMACPPECKFLRNSDGSFAGPLTCVKGGIECAGRHGGVKFYDEYPSQYYSTGGSVDINGPAVKDMAISVKKSVNNSVSRAAKTGPKAQTTTDTNLVTTKALEEAKEGMLITVNCPASCTPNCIVLGNVASCECKNSAGEICKVNKDNIVISD